MCRLVPDSEFGNLRRGSFRASSNQKPTGRLLPNHRRRHCPGGRHRWGVRRLAKFATGAGRAFALESPADSFRARMCRWERDYFGGLPAPAADNPDRDVDRKSPCVRNLDRSFANGVIPYPPVSQSEPDVAPVLEGQIVFPWQSPNPDWSWARGIRIAARVASQWIETQCRAPNGRKWPGRSALPPQRPGRFPSTPSPPPASVRPAALHL